MLLMLTIVRAMKMTCVVVAVPGETALTYSAAAGNDVGLELIIRSFRRLGLDVDHVNKSGRTALLIAVSRGHVECAAILAADGRADTRLRDPVTGLTADQLAVTCTGYPLKRPSPPDITSGAATTAHRGSTRTGPARTGRKDDLVGGGKEAGEAGGSRKPFNTSESLSRRILPAGNGRPRRRSSLPSMKIRFDDSLPSSSAVGRGLSREQTSTTTVDEEELEELIG